MKVKSLSHVRLFATPWTVAYQAPPSMGLSRQEYWSGVPSSMKICFNITHYHGNANQNHKRCHLISVIMVTNKKARDDKVLRIWTKGKFFTLLVGVQTSTATMENSVELP